MAYLIFIFAAVILLGGFLALTWYESKREARFLAPLRARLDQNVERLTFILAHIDFSAFLRDEVQSFARRIVHDSAHLSLQVVRAVERFLTGFVRRFRTRQAMSAAPRENAREFVKTLSDFKNGLKTTHPDALDVR